MVKYSNNRPAKAAGKEGISGISLSVISYMGTQGKYRALNKLFSWADLPDIDDHAPEEEPTNEGWWPVLEIQLAPEWWGAPSQGCDCRLHLSDA